MTSHCITWHDTTQAITSHQMTWPSHDLTPEQTSRHQNTSLQSTKHHHHGRAEGSFTAKKWFGHRAGRSPCAHSIGKCFLCYIVPFGNFRPRLVRALLVKVITPFISHLIVHPKYVSLPGIVGKHGNQPSLIVHSGLVATTTLAITKSCSRTFFNFQHFPAVLVQVFDGHFPHSESIQRCDMFFLLDHQNTPRIWRCRS